MGIATIARKWAKSHLKLEQLDYGETEAVVAVDNDTFEAIRKFYISEGGRHNDDEFRIVIKRQ